MTLIASTTSLPGQIQPATSAAMAASTTSVSRTMKAVHYRPGGSLKVGFHATELMAGATGEAKVEAKKASIAIDAKFQSMEDATKFGLEYLTYVLWAISPEGRADNLGEITLDHNNAHIKATTDMQTFGLIVTAEPYFAVTQPGNTVVLESIVPEGIGQGEDIEAKYELLGRGK